jgi:parallel beta-helix repeat protein
MKDLRRRLGFGLAVSSLVWAGAFVSTASAVPATLQCGATVTQSIELQNDVTGCNQGITVGADNIVFNLNGHTIACRPDVVGEGPGILLPNRTGVTVTSGTVRDCDAGVAIIGGSGNQVVQILATNNIGEVSNFAQTDFGDGIFVQNSSRNAIRNNIADHNGPFSGITLLGDSDNNVVEGNFSINNNLPNARAGHEDPSGSVQEDDGIRLETVSASAAPNFNQVRGNTVRNNGLDGIAVFPLANDNSIQGNTIEGNGFQGNIRRGDGIHIFSRVQRTLVSGNTVRNNARNGIRIDGTVTLPPGGLQNRIIGNTAVSNRRDPGPDPAFDLNEGNPFCDANLWQANIFETKNFPGADCVH